MTDLINPANWGGAQWVLVTIWAMSIATYVGVRLAGMSKKDPIEWWGGFIGHVVGYAALFFILAWGGFWA